MAKADFIHRIELLKGRNVLIIEDLNLGNMSVTNDIEEVVADIERMERIDAKIHMIVYADRDGIWDGYDARLGQFIQLSSDTWQEAVSSYIKKQLSV